MAGGCEILGAAYDEMKMCVEASRESTEIQSVFILECFYSIVQSTLPGIVLSKYIWCLLVLPNLNLTPAKDKMRLVLGD